VLIGKTFARSLSADKTYSSATSSLSPVEV
jgi:hypothetical protein